MYIVAMMEVSFAHFAKNRFEVMSMVTDVNVHNYYLCAMCAKMALSLWHYVTS